MGREENTRIKEKEEEGGAEKNTKWGQPYIPKSMQ